LEHVLSVGLLWRTAVSWRHLQEAQADRHISRPDAPEEAECQPAVFWRTWPLDVLCSSAAGGSLVLDIRIRLTDIQFIGIFAVYLEEDYRTESMKLQHACRQQPLPRKKQLPKKCVSDVEEGQE
jgi:hypothetical protein